MKSNRLKNIIIVVAVILLVALSASVILSVFGVFKSNGVDGGSKNVVVSEIEMKVEFSNETDWNEHNGIKLFYDDNGTTNITTDDLYYRIIRASVGNDSPNAQADGLVISNSSGTWYALSEVSISGVLELRVKSSYNKITSVRETSFYLNGKQLKLRADATLSVEGVTVTESSIIDSSVYLPKGTGVRVENFNGAVYL